MNKGCRVTRYILQDNLHGICPFYSEIKEFDRYPFYKVLTEISCVLFKGHLDRQPRNLGNENHGTGRNVVTLTSVWLQGV